MNYKFNKQLLIIFVIVLLLGNSVAWAGGGLLSGKLAAGSAFADLGRVAGGPFAARSRRRIVNQPEVEQVVYISPEITPFSKTGGLADVSNELPKAVAAGGMNVSVITLKYKNTPAAGLVDTGLSVNVRMGMEVIRTKIWEKKSGNMTVYLLENGKMTTEIYSGDSLKQALFLSEATFAAVELLVRVKKMKPPQIMHANDWQTALIPVFLKAKYNHHPIFSEVASVFSIHNLAYQGGKYNRFPRERFPELEIGGEHWYGLERPDDSEGFNLMRGAIYHADKIVAVSPNYSREIQTAAYGEGLDPDLRERTDDIEGIINGVSKEEWEPVEIQDKPKAKKELQKMLGLEVNAKIPLIGMATRLTDQKNVDHVLKVIERTLIETGGAIQFVFMGKGHPDDPYYHRMSEEMDRLSADPRWRGKLKFVVKLSHEESKKVFRGIDLYLMPSKFEPCGTKQQVALINGAPVVARRTGGLVNTVWEYDPQTGQGNGFMFNNVDEEEFYQALKRALYYYTLPEEWQKIIHNAQATDRSWNLPAQEYQEVYRGALVRKHSYKNEDLARANGISLVGLPGERQVEQVLPESI